MGFNEFLSSIFGNKSTRDMKEIQPWVNKVKAVYPEIEKLDNDALRAKTQELKTYIRNSAAEQRAKVDELKAKVESTELEDREALFNQIDKIEKEILDIYEKALDEVLPTAFAIVKDTARRFSENEEIVVREPLAGRRQRGDVEHGALRRTALRRRGIAQRQDCRNGHG